MENVDEDGNNSERQDGAEDGEQQKMFLMAAVGEKAKCVSWER